METRYQRVAREQAERKREREAKEIARRKVARGRSKRQWYISGPGGPPPRDPDGYDRDDLGISPDF